MEIDVTIKNQRGNRVHVIVDGKRYASVRVDEQIVILPQNTSLAFYSTMLEATLTLPLNLYPRVSHLEDQ